MENKKLDFIEDVNGLIRAWESGEGTDERTPIAPLIGVISKVVRSAFDSDVEAFVAMNELTNQYGKLVATQFRKPEYRHYFEIGVTLSHLCAGVTAHLGKNIKQAIDNLCEDYDTIPQYDYLESVDNHD